MNKKEISEIKKQLTPTRSTISRVCGCYVNGEKEKVTQFSDSFLTLPEEESFKYFEIFRKTLSGTVGKNLLTMEFPLAAEEEGGTQSALMDLLESRLEDEQLLDSFYDRVISSFVCSENYLILLVCAAYDVPGKASDGLEMFDASDNVYNHMFCCICPVSLAKPALSYDTAQQCFRNRIRDRIVDMPTLGFLFPAFHDRGSDIHSLLYYTKSADELHFDFTDEMLGTTLPLPSSSQNDIFHDVIEQGLGDGCEYELVQNLHEQIHAMAEEQKESPDPFMLDQGDVKTILEQAGADAEQISTFTQAYDEIAGEDARFLASNLTGTRKYEVRTPDIMIQVSPDRADLVERRVIDGRPCLVIPITDELTVNGIRVKP